MKRRLFSLFLALTLVVGMLPAPAFAQETEPTQVTEAATEAPATESPATEVPATEDPATEAPAAEPTPAPTEAPVPETTVAPAPTEAPAEPAPTEDEAVAAVQAMIDALPDVDDMSESYIDALEAAYSAYEALSAAQQAKITGAERLEALFDWVNGQVSTLADYVEEIKNSEGWTNRGTITWPVRLTGKTWLTLTGTNRIECDNPLDLNGYDLIIQGTGTLELVGKGGSSYKIGATLCDSTWTGTSSGGTLTIQGGTVKVSGSDQNAVCVKTLHMTGGSLEARGGKNAGIVCSALETNTTSGSLYATGEDYGISMYSPFYYGDAVNQMSILISNVRDAEPADMDVGDVNVIKYSEQKSVYMGEVTGPLFSVKAQKGYLYEGIAAQTATFAISAKNVDTSTLKTQWAGDHTGLTESLSADSKTLTVTTDAAVKQGTYDLTITDGSAVTKTVTVTVLGAPITVTTQPQDTYGRTLDGETWQGDDLATEVQGTLATGLTGNITYQWKLKDGTELDGFTQSTIKLADLYIADKLTRQTDKTWLSSAKVYCTLTVGSYSVDTDTVTMTASDCNYQRVNHVDGSCLQCGEFHSQNPLLVAEDGYFAVVPDESAEGAAKVGGNLVVGGTFYLTKDLRSRGLNAGNTTKDNKDTILDLQGHTLAWLHMDNFPYGTFTLKNGTLNQPVSSIAGGVLILDGVTFGSGCFQATNYSRLEITVKGNTLFRETVSFNNDYRDIHLQGGTFEKGISARDGEQALAFLDDGFAYQDSDGDIVDARYPEKIANKEIRVAAHTCDYVGGLCKCGRTCDHDGTVDADGYCTVCKSLVEVYAIGQTRYKSLEAALTAAKDGDTITLRGDFYQAAITVEINKSVTLDLGGHTLTGNAEDSVLLVLAENVIIQNGAVKNTFATESRPQVTVGNGNTNAGLTVKDVTFSAITDEVTCLIIRPSGKAKVESGTFNGGIYVDTDGSLIMTGGSAAVLMFEARYDTIQLSGGSFGYLPNPWPDYKRLLAEGYAFQSSDGKLVKLADMSSYAAEQVVKCTHPDGLTADTACPYCGTTCAHARYENGKCATCGYLCPHKNVEENDGVYTCGTCGMTMTVMVETGDGGSCTTDLAAALNNAEDGTYITVLDDVVLTSNADVVNGKEVTLDMNGHDINQNGRTLNVAGTDSKLIIKGAGNLSFTVNIKENGQLDMTDWTGTIVNVNLSGVCDFVGPTGDGHIDNLNIGNWRDGNVGTVTLQGGSIGKLWLNSFQDFQITLGSLLKSGYAAKSGSDYLPYDKAIKYVYQGQRENILYDLTIEPCPHTGLDDTGRCTYCNKTGFAAMVTKDGVSTGYTDFKSALLEVCNGKSGTLKLLQNADLGNFYQYEINGTLDLNGKDLSGRLACSDGSDLRIVNTGDAQSNLTDLTVKSGAKVTIADTTGSIFFDKVTVENGSVADLLSEGGAYRSDLGEKKWISADEAASATSLTNVTVQEAPVKSVTLTANKTTVTYGESETVTLSTTRTLIPAVTARYAWAEVLSDGTVQTFPEKVDTSFTLPEGLNAGVHTYRVSVTADNYTLSKTIDITVTKVAGTLTNKDYPTTFTYGDTVPTPKVENFTANNPSGTFSYYWEIPGDNGLPTTLPRGENPTDAGTYILHVEVASDGNYEAVTDDFTVTISPLTITSENIGYLLGENPVYNGKPQSPSFQSITANGMSLNYTLIGNTATNAGSYTMTVTGRGNFTGSVTIPWKILPRDLTNALVTLGAELTYNGQEQTQTVASVTVEGMDSPLTQGMDFQVTANSRTDAGDYSLAIGPASNNFTGIVDVSWSIAPKDISKASMVIIDHDPLTYNGKPQTPTNVVATVDGLNVTVDVAVTPQTDAGLHKMTVTGKGNFTGSKEVSWYIAYKSIEDATVNLDEMLTYNGQEQTQTITSVTVDGLSVDYTVTGNTGTDAGDYTLTVTGNGNFDGSQNVSWSIAKKDIGNAKIVLDAGLTYNDEEQTQTITSVTVDGLDVPTYTVTDNEGRDAKEYTLTVTGNGNFTGSQTAKWSIDPLDISKAATFGVIFDDLTYNGQAQTPDVVSVEVLIGTKLVKITFNVDVTPQVNAGEYKLAIIGTGNYTGRRNGITWKIKPKSIARAEIVFGPELTYNGQKQTQTITSVTVDGLSVDYTFTGNTGTDAGDYMLTINGIDNFTGTCYAEFEIARKDVTIEDTAVENSKVYDGTTTAAITSVGTPSDNYDGDGLQIVSGTAAYDDKNVGTGKTVTFTGFSLAGDRAGNYNLVSQPAAVTADITAKEITLDVTVKDKNFDGTTKAELDTVTHTDFVAGDDVKLENGEPSFAYPCARADIPIQFTDFRLTGADAGNYQLTNAQPEGVTAEIHPTPNYLDVTDKPEFDGKTTVTIDGAEYPIEEVSGQCYVNLPENGDLLTIYSFKDSTPTGSYTNYPTGMQVYQVTRQEGGAKAERITEFDNLLGYAGCSIRVSGKKGIRMITAIDQNVKKSLVSKNGMAGYTLEEYGTVVQWADTLGRDTLNLGNGKSNFAYKKGDADPVFAKVDGMIQYTNVLVGFTDAQCQPDLVMRPYIKLKDTATGETVTLYGGCVTRSIGYVAWQNRDTYKPGTASYKYVWSIINNVDTTGYPE